MTFMRNGSITLQNVANDGSLQGRSLQLLVHEQDMRFWLATIFWQRPKKDAARFKDQSKQIRPEAFLLTYGLFRLIGCSCRWLEI